MTFERGRGLLSSARRSIQIMAGRKASAAFPHTTIPLQLGAEGQTLDGRRTLGNLPQHIGNDRVQRPDPVVGILLGPAGVGEGQVVRPVRRGHQRPVRRVQRRVRALAADIAADHIRSRQGTTTILSPEPERIVSKASAIRSSGKRWVTTAARSSRRRLR